MYYNPRLRRQGPVEYDWMQDQFGSFPSTGYAPTSPQQEADQPDFGAYPTWAHGLMAQVYPRLDQAGRLPEPLVLEDSSEIGDATEVYVRKHPDCRKPDPITPKCAKEWSEAEAICASLAGRGKLPGSGRGWEEASKSVYAGILRRTVAAIPTSLRHGIGRRPVRRANADILGARNVRFARAVPAGDHVAR